MELIYQGDILVPLNEVGDFLLKYVKDQGLNRSLLDDGIDLIVKATIGGCPNNLWRINPLCCF